MSSTLHTGTPTIEVPNATVCAAVLLMAIGTGGIATEHTMQWGGTNFLTPPRRPLSIHSTWREEIAAQVTISERITAIRSNFEFSIVDLAAAFRTTRQTVYDWMAERQMPQPQSLARIRDLHALSATWRAEIGANIETLHRKFADKNALLAILTATDLDVDAAHHKLRSLSRARTAVAPQSKSLTNLMKEHGFRPPSKERQDDAAAQAGQ
jgi:transcriptional regulator with XRE-family HTH domain